MKILTWFNALWFALGIATFELGKWWGRNNPSQPPLMVCPLCDMRARYSYYTVTAHKILIRIPFIGKWLLGALMGFWYQTILKEGLKYGQRKHKSQTQVPRMSNGAHISKQ